MKKLNSRILIKMLLVIFILATSLAAYAGDTFCYDKTGNLDKRDRELAAAEKIYGMLSEDKGKELRALWDEFEEMKTPEALFAASMDRFEPILSNYYNNGGTWKKYDVAKEDIYIRVAPVKKSSNELWNFLEHLIEDAAEKGLIKG